MTEEREEEPGSPATAVHSAEIFCDACGRTTPHRILRVDPRSSSGGVRGIARCRTCRWTHPFSSAAEPTVTVARILSDGPMSVAGRVTLPARAELEVGSAVPASSPPVRILRIDRKVGGPARSARAEEIATLWVAPDRGALVPVSIVEGRRTRSARLSMPPDRRLGVHGTIEAEGIPLVIVGLRARGRTWKEPGDEFFAREVDRVYARRQLIPPAGRSDWSRSRERPMVRESSTSRSARSRSSPGTRRTRAIPRARRALGGATVQSSSPS